MNMPGHYSRNWKARELFKLFSKEGTLLRCSRSYESYIRTLRKAWELNKAYHQGQGSYSNNIKRKGLIQDIFKDRGIIYAAGSLERREGVIEEGSY